ncbi:MAG TPA: DUF1761 domain-containing protein [Bacteroidia bacterium]|nr:DUF1761 domain-containing protein [Bacteroidia bacterium]
MDLNWIVLLLSALLPLVVGFIWYSPMLFAKAWMKASGLDEEKLKGANLVKIFGLTYLLSIFIAISINFIVIHQWHIYSILAEEAGIADPNSEIGQYLKNFLEKYGHNFRTFKHGAFHGALSGILLAWPMIAVNALFERRGTKYVAINAGFWILSFMLMGGVICAFN